MLIKCAFVVGLAFLAGCNSSSGEAGSESGPGEVSFAGLTYDVRPGRGFVGLSETLETDMPMQGFATYEGVLRGEATGIYENGTSKLEVDFTNAAVSASGSVDFKGQGGIGKVTFDEGAVISGVTFDNSNGVIDPEQTATVFGRFYGNDGNVAAGTVAVPLSQGNHFVGAFIAERE